MLKWIIQEFLNFKWALTRENSRISVVFEILLKAYRKSIDIEMKIIIRFGTKTNHMYRKGWTDFFQFVWEGPSVCSNRGVRIRQIPVITVVAVLHPSCQLLWESYVFCPYTSLHIPGFILLSSKEISQENKSNPEHSKLCYLGTIYQFSLCCFHFSVTPLVRFSQPRHFHNS